MDESRTRGGKQDRDDPSTSYYARKKVSALRTTCQKYTSNLTELQLEHVNKSYNGLSLNKEENHESIKINIKNHTGPFVGEGRYKHTGEQARVI